MPMDLTKAHLPLLIVCSLLVGAVGLGSFMSNLQHDVKDNTKNIAEIKPEIDILKEFKTAQTVEYAALRRDVNELGTTVVRELTAMRISLINMDVMEGGDGDEHK